MIFRLAVNDLHICVKYSFVQCIFGYLFIKSSLNDCYWIFYVCRIAFLFWFEEYGNFIFNFHFVRWKTIRNVLFCMGYGKKYLMFHIKKNM